MEPRVLHVYRCSNCYTLATSTVRVSDPPLACCLCRRWMRYSHEEPIVTKALQDLARLGVVYNPFVPKADVLLACTICRQKKPRSELLDLKAVGRFCSEACAEAGRAQYRRYLDQLEAERKAEERRSRPWLT